MYVWSLPLVNVFCHFYSRSSTRTSHRDREQTAAPEEQVEDGDGLCQFIDARQLHFHRRQHRHIRPWNKQENVVHDTFFFVKMPDRSSHNYTILLSSQVQLRTLLHVSYSKLRISGHFEFFFGVHWTLMRYACIEISYFFLPANMTNIALSWTCT